MRDVSEHTPQNAMSENPYETPKAEVLNPVGSTASEETRRKYIKHEASVKSVGILYWLGALALVVMAFAPLVELGEGRGGSRDPGYALGFAAVLLAVGALQFWTGAKLRKLDQVARIPCGTLSGLGLLAFPWGTLLNAYVLYLIFGPKGTVVFSREYKEVIAATPHIKYKSSIIVVVCLVLLVLLLLVVIGALMIRR